MNTPTRAIVVMFALAATLGTSACNEAPAAPTTPAGSTSVVVLFAGTLPVGGSSFFSVLVTQTQVVGVTLASTALIPAGPAVPTPVNLGLGIPSGTDCALRSPAVTVSPGLTSHIAVQLDPGTYCVRIADAGMFPAPMEFAVRIALGQDAAGTPAGATEGFSSSLAVSGSSSRTFTATASGTVRLTLQSLGAPATAVGLGLGIPRADGTGCILTQSLTTGPGAGPHIAVGVQPGVYCVKVFDAGMLPSPATFFVQIVYP